MEANKTSGMAVASLILGIASLVLCCIPLLNIVLALIGLILGIIVLVKHENGKGLAIAGIVCSVIALMLGVQFVLAIISAASAGDLHITNDSSLFTYNGYSTNNFFDFVRYIIDNN